MGAEFSGHRPKRPHLLQRLSPAIRIWTLGICSNFSLPNHILLVKERSDGLWTLPGGWADVNDSPAQAVEKEILEESGYKAKAIKIAAVYDRNKHGHPYHLYHTYKLFFLCEITGGKPSKTMETDGVGFFAENNLPPLSVDRVTAAQIKRMFEHYRNPGLATDFD